MKQIFHYDLDDLALGSAVLGSGGGGDPAYDLMITKQLLVENGPVTLENLNEVPDEELIVPVCYMGAPLISIEKIPTGDEFKKLISLIEEAYLKKINYVMAAEIGGGNAFTPLIVASKLGLKVIDADTIGRAFPELQHSSCNLMGVSSSTSYLADTLCNTEIIHAKDSYEMEEKCRTATIKMGSSSAICFYIMNGKEAKRATISGSISQALCIGRTIRNSKERNQNPLADLLNYCEGLLIDSGTIVDIDQVISSGFLKGTVSIQTDSGLLKIAYQNEYLAIFRNQQPLISTPDIITLLESETSTPITSETLAYGLRVSIIGIPAPKIWKTAKGLELVGPRSFGYQFDYTPIYREKI